MKELHGWMTAQLEEHRTEPNSGLGKAISYLLNHWTKLTLFLRQPGCPNRQQYRRAFVKEGDSESQECTLLQDAERRRSTGDLFMSLIHTCELNGVNPFDYLTELLRHRGGAEAHPSAWMPWNYRETVARCTRPTAA